MTPACDVAIVGGGPAGTACAGLLAQRGRSVVVLERDDYTQPRVGETLGAEVGALVAELGATAAADVLARQVPFELVRSAWGTDVPAERSSILHPLGNGWHVERVAFDRALADWAASTGASIRRGVGRCTVGREGGSIVVTPSRAAPVRARVLVDASGRGAVVSGGIAQRHWLAVDREVAVLAHFRPGFGVEHGPELLLEAVEHGFWYSAPQPDGTLVCVFVTDADVLTTLGRGRHARFTRALADSSLTRARLESHSMVGSPIVVRADSGRLVPAQGPDWFAVGDAAMGVDPLGGSGVTRALRSAIEVVNLVERPVTEDRLAARFTSYLDERAAYYLLEERWPDAPFWSRRRPRADLAGPIELDPEAPLRWEREPPAFVEALLPPHAIDTIRGMLAVRTLPAHVLLHAVREVAPVGDLRLLIGLQHLLELGTVAAS